MSGRRFKATGDEPLEIVNSGTEDWIGAEEHDDDVLAFVGTCQSCGMYWDVRQRTVCTCGGEVL